MHRIFLGLAAALLCLSGVSGVQAADCGPLKLLNKIQMAPFGATDVMVVPVTINGVAKGMIFDTGAAESQISRITAQELELPVRERRSEARDINGHASSDAAMVGQLAFGNMRRAGIALRIWPDPNFGKDAPLVAGVMSRDLLSGYDLDVDFGTGVLKLFSREHCFGAIDYWHPAAMAAMQVTIRDRHIHIPVMLDGHAFDAVIDTGSQHSTISLPVAQRVFGLSLNSPGVTPLGAVNNDPALTGFVRTFDTLSFSGVTVHAPDMMILPDRMSAGDRIRRPRDWYNSSPATLPEVIIGMDVLRHLHVYLAPDERNFYVALTASPVHRQAANP
jgi:predicted aspartyl protease